MSEATKAAAKAAADLCTAIVQDIDLAYPAIRVGTWIAGAALASGEYPIELTLTEIVNGSKRNGIVLRGTGGNFSTIRTGLQQLLEQGYLRAKQGRKKQGGFSTHYYTLLSPPSGAKPVRRISRRLRRSVA
jgi:hypothetical protein